MTTTKQDAITEAREHLEHELALAEGKMEEVEDEVRAMKSYLSDVRTALGGLFAAMDEDEDAEDEAEALVAYFERCIPEAVRQQFAMVVVRPSHRVRAPYPLVIGLRLPDPATGERVPFGWWLTDQTDMNVLSQDVASGEFVGWALGQFGVDPGYDYAEGVMYLWREGFRPDPHVPFAWIGKGHGGERSYLYFYANGTEASAQTEIGSASPFRPRVHFAFAPFYSGPEQRAIPEGDIGKSTSAREALWGTLECE